MTEQQLRRKPSSLKTEGRFRFSLKILFVAMTLAAAVAAFVANFPEIALLALLMALIAFEAGVSWILQALGEHLGKSRYRRAVIAVLICTAGGCLILALIPMTSDTRPSVLLGCFVALVILGMVISSKAK